MVQNDVINEPAAPPTNTDAMSWVEHYLAFLSSKNMQQQKAQGCGHCNKISCNRRNSPHVVANASSWYLEQQETPSAIVADENPLDNTW